MYLISFVHFLFGFAVNSLLFQSVKYHLLFFSGEITGVNVWAGMMLSCPGKIISGSSMITSMTAMIIFGPDMAKSIAGLFMSMTSMTISGCKHNFRYDNW